MPLRKRSDRAKKEEAQRVEQGEKAMALPPSERSKRIRSLIAVEAEAFLERRHQKIKSLKLRDLNFNPILLRLVRDMHSLDTPEAVVNYLVTSTLRAGEETAYGWLVDLFLPPLFGASTPPEREDPYKWEGYKEIDKEIERPNPSTGKVARHLISLKSGPFTINDTMAREMAENVKSLQKFGKEPVIYGVTYGRADQLSNKPYIVKGEFPDDRVAILVGREFWDWLAGYDNAHLDILNGIADGEAAFAAKLGVSLRAALKEKKKTLIKEFTEEFKIRPGDDMWARLAETAFVGSSTPSKKAKAATKTPKVRRARKPTRKKST